MGWRRIISNPILLISALFPIVRVVGVEGRVNRATVSGVFFMQWCVFYAVVCFLRSGVFFYAVVCFLRSGVFFTQWCVFYAVVCFLCSSVPTAGVVMVVDGGAIDNVEREGL